LLRNIGCDSHEDRNWCEVEALDGSIAGWAAAEFLLPYVGADPAALTTPAIAADSVARTAAGQVSGNLAMAGISDHLITLNSGDILTVVASALPVGARAIVFGPQGEILAEIDAADAPTSIEFAESGEALLRLVEMEGRGGVYEIDLRID
jgi:hypothetical protein